MRLMIRVAAIMGCVALIGGCNNDNPKTNEHMDHSIMKEDTNAADHSAMDADMMGGHMNHDDVLRLHDSTGENELKIPPMLKNEHKEDVVYTVRAQKGITEIFDGTKTKTYGYNGSFLGPMIPLKKGDRVKIRMINELDEETTFHWHGLEVAGDIDGGPHDPIKPGEEKEIEFTVKQDAATLWFHPHPTGKTASQVYQGLAGLLYIEDEQSQSLGLPNDYGKNDIPLIFQDRIFDDKKQLNYSSSMNSDGTIGDTLLINGTVNPKLTVNKEKVRLRLVNGSNARNYTFKLNTGDSFIQIATDGGFLNNPIYMKEITLTPSERAEIIIDFTKLNRANDIALINEDGSILLPFNISGQNGSISKIPARINDFLVTDEEKNLPVTKTIELFGMMEHVTINGKKFDPKRIDLTQKQGVTEIWEIHNKPDMMGGMIHPFHIHGTQFKIISRDGKEPTESEQGWKDSISIKPDERVKIAIQFKEKGVFMFHCHILEHEDNGMMGQVKVE